MDLRNSCTSRDNTFSGKAGDEETEEENHRGKKRHSKSKRQGETHGEKGEQRVRIASKLGVRTLMKSTKDLEKGRSLVGERQTEFSSEKNGAWETGEREGEVSSTFDNGSHGIESLRADREGRRSKLLGPNYPA